MKIDDYDWHSESSSGGFFGLSKFRNATAHMVLYLYWANSKGLMKKDFEMTKNWDKKLAKFSADMTYGYSLLRWHFDGAIVSYCMTDVGIRFTEQCYDNYLKQLETSHKNHLYKTQAKHYDYKAIERYLDNVYDNFINAQSV